MGCISIPRTRLAAAVGAAMGILVTVAIHWLIA